MMATTDRLQPRSGHPRAVDWMLAAYNLLMIGRWAPLVPQHETARWLVAVHGIALGVPWLLTRAPAPDQRWLKRFYECYPLAWICAFWRELDVHGRFVSNLPYDRTLAWLDRAVFGLHLNSAWIEALPGRAFSEMMHLFYFSYYPLMLAVPLLLVFCRRGPLRREGVLRIAACYLACYLVYALWPTTGPAFLGVAFPDSVREGDYVEIGQIGAYGRVLANRFNGFGEYDEVMLTDEPMLSMYAGQEEQPLVTFKTARA